MKLKLIKKTKENHCRGFTLVEMLVAMTIFSIAVSIATALLVSTFQLYQYNSQYQSLLNQTSYAAEYMSRALRMAANSNACGFNGNYEVSGDSSIKFFNSNDGKCWKFYLDRGVLRVDIDGNSYNLISPEKFNVNNFKIDVNNNSGQPRVTFYLDVRAKSNTLVSKPKIKIQTTVSQRNLNE